MGQQLGCAGPFGKPIEFREAQNTAENLANDVCDQPSDEDNDEHDDQPRQ